MLLSSGRSFQHQIMGKLYKMGTNSMGIALSVHFIVTWIQSMLKDTAHFAWIQNPAENNISSYLYELSCSPFWFTCAFLALLWNKIATRDQYPLYHPHKLLTNPCPWDLANRHPNANAVSRSATSKCKIIKTSHLPSSADDWFSVSSLLNLGRVRTHTDHERNMPLVPEDQVLS